MGRGGRDGRSSISLIIPTKKDLATASKMNQKKFLHNDNAYNRWQTMFNNKKTVENKTPIQKDSEIDLLSSQLDTLKANQTELKLKFADEAEVKRTKEELDEVNNKSKELDEVVTDFINCRNGR